MARKREHTQSITEPIEVIDMKGWPSPLASERTLPPGTSITLPPSCRGDCAETVADLFRFLRRAREYLIEADRQLRLDELTTEEHAARKAWHAEMDAGDEWTGETAEAHIDCTEGIIFFFENTIPEVTAQLDGKHFLLQVDDGRLAWEKLKITETIRALRNDAAALLVRVARDIPRH